MKSRTLDGYAIRNWFRSGHREVDLHKKHINAINVFPVPDGDTGTNLSMTLKAMAERPVSTPSFGRMLEQISELGLANARGNSGIIFASYVNGIAEEGRLYETVTLSEFSALAHKAVDYVYRAIDNPVEGTMISVIKDWASYLLSRHHEFEFFEDLLQGAYVAAKVSLAQTPEKLAVLKRNNVVDSGAEGFVHFLKGVNRFFSQEALPAIEEEPEEAEIPRIPEDSVSMFRYCSEFLLKQGTPGVEGLREELESLGDSLIISSGHEKTRIHLHTNHPETVIKRLLIRGEVLEQKVEDMDLQQGVLNHQKSPVALLTDSIADLPDDLILKHQIHTVPLTLMMGEAPYLDKRTITLRGLFEAMGSGGSYPTSAQPEPSRVREELEKLFQHYDSVIVITVSEKLSGTCGVFKKEAEKLGHPVTVIDSRLNSGAQGLLVKKAAELLDGGCTHEETVGKIQQLIPKTKIYVCLDTIANAIRGGRVPDTLGRVAMALGARPIMTLDSLGKGAAFGVGFSRGAMTRKILKLVRKTHKEKGIQSYSIVHADNPLLAQDYAEAIKHITGQPPEFITEISAVTAIHSGPGCVAVSLIEK